METRSVWSDRLVRGFAVLRGAVLIVLSMSLILAPEKVMPGSSSEPARTLALMLASRTMLLGILLVGLAIKGRRIGLAWVLLADAALQVFDTGLALVTDASATALVPAAIGALELWAGLFLLRATRRER